MRGNGAPRHVGRHRAPRRFTPRHAAPGLTLEPRRLTAATAVAGCLGLLAVGGSGVAADAEPAQSDGAVSMLLTDRLVAEKEQSRSLAGGRGPATPTPSSSPATPQSVAAKVVTTVAGLDKRQTRNAIAVVAVAQDMGVSRRGMIVAMATALQECYLYNCASHAVPESLNYSHDKVSADHDSVGVFQQRPSMGWGTVENLMKPEYQARNFFRKLLKIDGWEDMSVTRAAQKVQVSAYPDAYAKHESLATKIVDALI